MTWSRHIGRINSTVQLMHDVGTNRPLGDAARLAIEDELAALKAEVEGFMASPPDRPSTLVRRLDAFEGLQARVNFYRGVLQIHVAELEAHKVQSAAVAESLLSERSA